MNPEQNWLDEVHDAMREIRFVSTRLENEAGGIEHFGLERLADRLRTLADILGVAVEQISAAVHANLNDQVSTQQQHVVDMFRVALEQAQKEEAL